MVFFVQKFGGTSVATPDRIARVADRVLTRLKKGDQVVLVISAMAGVTNDLIRLAHQFSGEEGDPEYDVVISAGEQISAGLMALALSRLGVKTRSFLAWQLPFLTDDQFSKAEVKSNSLSTLEMALNEGNVPVVSGFQGVTASGRLTTLGRGGSDLTAVALAAILKATCETYKDVDGIYTADPNIVSAAQCLEYVDYTDMLAMAIHGSKVLQARSVAYAAKNNVPVHVLSSFTEHSGTHVAAFPQTRPPICGIAISSPLVAVDITFHPTLWTFITTALQTKYLPFNLIEKTTSTARLLFSRTDFQEVQNFCQTASAITCWNMSPMEQALSRLTVIGQNGTKQQERMKRQLTEAHIPVQRTTTESSPCASCTFLVHSEDAKRGMQILHHACGLDKKEK
ncbi:MAG: aspartate kinase [Holosporales bacterium]|nr:aspartate kinase [Holosporales bacterium]